MTEEPHVPTLSEIWDFLVGLKEATEAGFTRVASEIGDLGAGVGSLRSDLRTVESSLRSDLSSLRSDVSAVRSDLSRLEARVARIEGWNLDRRFDALELRVARLEQAWQR